MTRAAHLRYQHKPFIGSSHTWALRQCSTIPNSSRVLDIGSGSGAIGKALRAKGIHDIYAVEIDEEARKNTASIYQMIGTSLDDFQGQTFDLILMLDVLEHLSDPDTVYKQAAGLLKPGGLMLVSVPNVAHWSSRFLLFFGIFHYTDRGILDRTHMRFFTRRSFREFLNNAPGLVVDQLDASIAPMEFVLPGWLSQNPLFTWFSKMRLSLAQCLPGLLAYQHLSALRRSAS